MSFSNKLKAVIRSPSEQNPAVNSHFISVPGWLLCDILLPLPSHHNRLRAGDCGPCICMVQWTLRKMFTSLEKSWKPQMRLHVVGHIDGVQLVCQKPITEVHPLFLPTRVDGNDPDVHHDYNAYNQVVFLQDYVGHQWNQVQGFLLWPIKLHHHHQQICPGEHSTAR